MKTTPKKQSPKPRTATVTKSKTAKATPAKKGGKPTVIKIVLGKGDKKKVTVNPKPKPKKATLRNPQDIPAPLPTGAAVDPAAEQDAPAVRFIRRCDILLTEEGAIQLRAARISKASAPAVLFANVKHPTDNDGHETWENYRRLETYVKTAPAKERAKAPQRLHEHVEVEDSVRLFGADSTDIRNRAAAALGFRPSKARFIAGVVDCVTGEVYLWPKDVMMDGTPSLAQERTYQRPAPPAQPSQYFPTHVNGWSWSPERGFVPNKAAKTDCINN